MAPVATLVSHPSRRLLSSALVGKATRHLPARVEWLAEATACDLVPEQPVSAAELEESLRAALNSEPVDVVVQEATGRRKKVLLADMDSTMIDQECIDELADEVGLKERVAAITARSMNGEIAFEPALRERVALLKGLDESVVADIIARRITLAAGARQLVGTMRAHGAWTAMVSGGFTAFTGPIAEKLGFDENRANVLLARDGKLSGAVREPILGREAKAAALADITAGRGLTPRDVIAVGDGANDLDMIRLAGTGVALHAKPAVAAQAPIRIEHGDLTALLYLQGYRQSEFAA